jgi:hypothetical protein
MDAIVFRETQRMPRSWRWPVIAVTVGGVVLYVWAASIAGARSLGTVVGGIAILVGLGVALLATVARLEVNVTRTAVEVRWVPLARRTFPLATIFGAEAVTYRPIRQFGGWGIRFGRGGARAFSMSGDRAVRLTLVDGTEVFLGSLEPEALAGAIERGRVR